MSVVISVLSPVLVGDSGIALEVVMPLSDADGLNGFQGTELGDGGLACDSGTDADGLNGFQGTELGDDGLGGDSDSGLEAVMSISGTVGLNGFRNIELGD